jgi:hypothetical protein
MLAILRMQEDSMVPEQQIVVRKVDQRLWRQLRTEAVRRGITTGALLNEIIREYLARQQG